MEDLLKLRLSLEPESWHGLDSEGIWARVVSKTLTQKVVAKLDNIPFFATGLSFGDKVIARCEGGELLLESVLERSGNSTYRIFVASEETDVSEKLADLKTAMCDWEMTKFRGGLLRAVNVDMLADISAVYKILKEGQTNGAWYFEEGHVSHSLPEDQAPRNQSN